MTLLEAGLIQPGNCDFAGEVGKFFSQSCAPGAKDSNYDPQGTNPDSLCDLCIGNDGEHRKPSHFVFQFLGNVKRNYKMEILPIFQNFVLVTTIHSYIIITA